MLLDLAVEAGKGPLTAEVCVVGAGPVGIALAQRLAVRRDVLLIESGLQEIAAPYQDLNPGSIEGLHSSSQGNEARARAFGGTGRLWAGQCAPLFAQDFLAREGVTDVSWPLSLEDIEPYYREAEKFFSLRPPVVYDGQNWDGFPLSESPRPPAGGVTPFFTVYTPHPDVGAHYWSEFVQSERISVLLGSTVTRVHAAQRASGRLTLDVAGTNNERLTVQARRVVLCLGAVENARLLLNSPGRQEVPLGDHSGHLGQHYQDHPNAFVGEVSVDDPRPLQDLFQLLYAHGQRFWPKLALSEDARNARGSLNAVCNVVFDYGAGTAVESMKQIYRTRGRVLMSAEGRRLALDIVRDLPGVIGTMRRRRRGLSPGSPPRRIQLQIHTEQSPDTTSRVTVDPKRLDIFGMPQSVVTWELGEHDQHAMLVMADEASRTLSETYGASVTLEPWVRDSVTEWASHISDAYHPAGTTRMSELRDEGVVTSDLEVWDVPGLFVCGASVFPSSGFANPTLTAVALGIRLADHIEQSISTKD